MGEYILNSRGFSGLEMLEEFLKGHKGFIAGGCFKDLLGEETKDPRDIDIWFRNEKDYQEAEEYFEKLCEESQEGDVGWYRIYNTDNVRGFWNYEKDLTVELVKKTFGTPKEILDQFDFTITKFAFYPNEEGDGYNTYYSSDFFNAIEEKRVTIDYKCLHPVGTFDRMLKYAKYGYQADKESKLLVLSKINQLDFDVSTIYEELSDFLEEEWY